MKTEYVEGSVSTVLGENLDTPIAFKVSYEAYENLDECRGSEDWPSDSQILKIVNTKRANNARQAEVARLTAEKKAEIEATPEFKRKSLVKDILSSNPKLSQAKAESMADAILAAE